VKEETERERKMSKQKQTTLFQTWGYEGNLPPSQQRVERDIGSAAANGDENLFSDDDEEFNRIINATLQPSTSNHGNKQQQATTLNTSTASGQKRVQISTNKRIESLPGFDMNAGQTWIYPTNKSYRSYQHDIVKSCLFENTLVCLPTGLGKTFIAAVVMYNFYRWYPQGKIVFMAPTKPLVAQQIEACFNVMGIPQEDTMEMTGSVSIPARQRGWQAKRVFFLTPQVMSNDLSRGLFPAKEVKLLIVDEAHKAQGDYAYCQVARELSRSESVVRIVALSATPGNDLPAVRAVLQNLFISHIELRHEESPDILPYTNARIVDKIVIKMGDEMLAMKNSLLSVMEIFIKRLASHQAVRQGHNPSTYSKFAILRSRDEWRQNPPGPLPPNIKGVVEGDFAVAMSLYHGYDLMLQHGLRPFYNFFNKKDEQFSAKRIKQSLSKVSAWRDLMATLTEKFSGDASNARLNQSRILLTQGSHASQPKIETSHPKIEKLIQVVLEHFQNYKERNLDTRVMIFSQYRDSVNEVVGCLSEHAPTIKPMSFVGQAGTVGKKGLTQKEQIEVINRFRTGGYNTLVATCVGEEGLDIGEVDLIVLFDVSKSPIRLVQRMGRTGRKREGRIVVLVTEGIEERKYNQSLISKRSINKAILEMDKLVHMLYQGAPRMVPEGLDPTCHQMKMITGEFKARSTTAAESKGTVKQQKGHRYDVFKKNCGFLSEEQQERWSREFTHTDSVKRVAGAREYWTRDYEIFTPEKSQQNMEKVETYDLCEYALWQTGEQFRLHVGDSVLSSTYNKMVRLINDPDSLEAKEQNLLRLIESRKTGLPSLQSTQDDDKREANNIMNYFRPSQSKPAAAVSEKKTEKTKKQNSRENIAVLPKAAEVSGGYFDGDIVIIDEVAAVTQGPQVWPPLVPESSTIATAGEDGLSSPHNKSLERALLSELLSSDDEDSGFDSLPDSPVFKLNLQKLTEDPEWKEKIRTEIDNNKESTAETWNTAREKYANLYLLSSKRYRESIQLYPLQLQPGDEHYDDGFGDDEMDFGDLLSARKQMSGEYNVKRDPIPGPGHLQPAAEEGGGDPWTPFQLDSPETELFASSQPSAEQLKTESRRRRSQVSSATADITEFHLGSPVLEDPGSPEIPHISPEKSKLSPKSPSGPAFLDTPASPIIMKQSSQLRRIQDRQQARVSNIKVSRKMETSTPVNPVASRKRAISNLTPVKAWKTAENFSPVLKKRKSSLNQSVVDNNFNNSDDFKDSDAFKDEDDDMFKDISMPANQDPSVLGATQLLSILNKTSGESLTESSVQPRSPMTALYDARQHRQQQQQLLQLIAEEARPTGIVRPVENRDAAPPSSSSSRQGRLLREEPPRRVKKRLSDVFVEPNLLHGMSGESSVAVPEPEPLWVNKRLPTVLVESRKMEPHENLLQDVFGDSTFLEPEPLRVKKRLSDLLVESQELEPQEKLLLGKSSVAEPEPSRISAAAPPNSGEKINFDGYEVGDANFDLDFSEDMFADPEPSLHQKTIQKKKGTMCPICGEEVEGDEGGLEINAHVDLCLSKQLIEEFSQQPPPSSVATSTSAQTSTRNRSSSGGSGLNQISWLSRGDESKRKTTKNSSSSLTNFSVGSSFATSPQQQPPDAAALKKSSDSTELRPESDGSTWVRPRLSTSPDSSSSVMSHSRVRGSSRSFLSNSRARLESSEEDSPVFRGKRKYAMVIASQAVSPVKCDPSTSLDRSSSPEPEPFSSPELEPYSRKKRTGAGAGFLDVEAVVSGSEASEDEHVENEDAFEASFVDDASQSKDDTAMYLRSIKSPEFKRPKPRQLRPITDDIFSQVPEDFEGSYIEDSFCVGSEEEVDYISEPDILDLLDQAAEKKPKARNRKEKNNKPEKPSTGKRRRIIAPEDDSIAEESRIEVKPAGSSVTHNSKVDHSVIDDDDDPFADDMILTQSLSLLHDYKPTQVLRSTSESNSTARMASDIPSLSTATSGTATSETSSTARRSSARQQSSTAYPSITTTLTAATSQPSLTATASEITTPETAKSMTKMLSARQSISPTRTSTVTSSNGAITSAASLDDSDYCLKPVLSTSLGCEERPTIVIASTEVNKLPGIISALKHDHQMNVVVRSSEIQFIVSQRMAVIRIPEIEFCPGTSRKKVEDKLSEMREDYDKCVVIAESEKVKPGERARTRNRTKVYDLTVAQLAATRVTVLYSESKECTAKLLANLVTREAEKGMGLPRGLKLTVSQEEMVKWVLNLPAIGLGSALHLVHAFTTLKNFIRAPVKVLREEGKLSEGRARNLVNILTSKYNAQTIDFVPL